jgi:hypothetical protein
MTECYREEEVFLFSHTPYSSLEYNKNIPGNFLPLFNQQISVECHFMIDVFLCKTHLAFTVESGFEQGRSESGRLISKSSLSPK